MKKFIALTFILFSLSACGTTTVLEKPELINHIPLQITEPEPLVLGDPNWKILTNKTVIPPNQTYFALTPDDYSTITINQQKMLGYIMQERNIINSLKDYYQPDKAKAVTK